MFSDKNDAYDIQIWLRENTSKDSLIITPPYIDEHSFASFRVHSERSILALNSELARVAISQGLEETLRTRLDDLSKDGFSPALLTGDYGKMYHAIYEGYNNLNEDDIVRLSKKYDANYFIREKPSELNLTVVYENDEYILYEI